MKKYVLFLGICLISIFNFNSSVKALNTTCANVILENGEYHIILDNNDIIIDSSTVDATKMTQIELLLSVWSSKNWYILEDNSNGKVIVVLTNSYVQGAETKNITNVDWLRNGTLNTYDFIIFEISNNTITSTTIKQKNSSYVVYSFSSNGGTAINSSSGYFVYGYDNPAANTYTFEETVTCNYIPSTINAPTFEASYTEYEGVNAAVNVTINFIDFDLEKYDYFISYDEGQTYQNINSRVSYYEGKYIVTRLDNFNITAKVVDKSSGASIVSSYYEDSITPVEDYIIFYEDSTKYEYVTVDAKDYLYSKTIRIYPLFTVPNLQYRVSLDGGETYTYFNDLYEKKVFKNTSFFVEVLDSDYNVIAFKNFGTRGFEETEEIGSQLVFYEYEDPEDSTKRIVSLKVVNINPDYYYFVQSGNSAYSRVYPLTWENGTYYFNSTDKIISYCARITDSNLNVIKEECYIPKSLSETQLFSSYINKLIDFVDARTVQIMKISDTIDYIYLKLPEDYRVLLEFIYLAMCIGAIVWNLRK